jgi:hypothetical protein
MQIEKSDISNLKFEESVKSQKPKKNVMLNLVQHPCLPAGRKQKHGFTRP